jgi:hypothetical protein
MNPVRKNIAEHPHIDHCLKWLDHNATKAINAGVNIYVEIGIADEPKTPEMNKKDHAMIADIHKQAIIKSIGKRIAMSDYSYDACKALLVIWFAKEKELNGEPLKKPPETVTCPISGDRITVRPSVTSFGKKIDCEWMEFLYLIGAESGVIWSEPALKEYSSYREAQTK